MEAHAARRRTVESVVFRALHDSRIVSVRTLRLRRREISQIATADAGRRWLNPARDIISFSIYQQDKIRTYETTYFL